MDDFFHDTNDLGNELPPEVDDAYTESLLLNAGEVENYMRGDMDAFAGVVAPDDAIYQFPPFFHAVWQLICSAALAPGRVFERLALGIPRGHAKSFVIKLYVIFVILFTKKRYILLIGASAGKAEALIHDIWSMLESSNIRSIFGNVNADASANRNNKKVFVFRGRKIILEAAGTGTAIRGANQGNARPDVMIFDDAQSSTCAESDVESLAFRTWFFGTALKAKSMFGCTFIYIGNMYRDIENPPQSGLYNCMLRNLQLDPTWTSLISGAILADGTALWEELQPLAALLTEWESDRHNGQEEIFLSEVLNIPNGAKSRHVDTSKFSILHHHDKHPHQGHFIVLDPATSAATRDQFVINRCKLIDGRVVTVEIIAEKMSSPKAVARVLEEAIRHNVPLICVEANAFQTSLVEWFDFIIGQQGLHGLKIQPYHQSANKNGRLMRWFRGMERGEMQLTPETRSIVVDQSVKFKPEKANNLDDIIDSCEMAQRCGMMYSHLMQTALETEYSTTGQYVLDNYETEISPSSSF